MSDTFRFSGRTRGIQREHRLLAAHGLGVAVGAHLRHHEIHVHIPSMVRDAVLARALEDEDSLDVRAVVDGGVRNFLEFYGLGTSFPDVRGADPLRLLVDNSVFERSRREACEDYRMRAANARAGQHGHRRIRHHGHVDRHEVSFSTTMQLESVRYSTGAVEDLEVGQFFGLAGLVRLP